MPPKDGAAQGAPPGGGGGDRLSGLRDEVLLRVMSHLKAWEAVRTCVLSKRWRNLWASASRLDVRTCLCPGVGGGGDGLPGPRPRARQRKFAAFATALLLRRRQRVPLDSLRLCWTRETVHGDANTWVAHAVRRGAEEIELSAKHHADWHPSPEYMSFIAGDNDTFKIRLKVLKFVYIRLDATTLTQLCSRCTCLEELELKDCQIPQATKIRSTKLKRLTMIRCRIPKGLSVYAPNLGLVEFSGNFGYVPWIQNLGLLAASNVNQRAPHKYPEYPGLGSCNVKILKLSRVKLDDTTLAQLCSVCTSLEELELEDCLVVGKEIRSKSLRSLTMINCEFAIDSGVNVPNLLSLRCTRPFRHAPRFRNMEFIVTAIIALDDSCMSSDSQWTWGEDDIDESDDDDDFFAHLGAEDSGDSSDSESDEDEDAESDHGGDLPALSGAEDSDDNSDSESDPDEHDESDHGGDLPAHSGAEDSDDNSDSEFSQYEEDESDHDGNQFVHSGAESNDNSDNEPDQDGEDESDHDVESDPDGAHSSDGNEKSDNNNEDKSYLDDDIFGHAAAEDSDDEVDGRTMGYDEIAEEYNGDCGGMFGGDGMLCSLSNVRRMDLSAHSGEVLLMRESKSCTDFKNLKTLSLGEWCITPDLDVLASILRRSPNLENLFVHLDMANKSRVGFNTRANSFSCTNLKKLEITCCKHDKMVHILAQFFLENSITRKKIFVHHTACTCDVKRDTDSQAKRKAQAQTEAEKRPAKQIKPGN